MKKIFSFIIVLSLVFSFCSIGVSAANEEIVILFESDVHCAVDGYAKISALKKELKTASNFVGVVSSGDFVQGSSLGAVSQGSYIVDIMNLVGYDAITLGNHEFDYKINRLNELVSSMNTKPVSSNFIDLKTGKTVFEPYKMVSYGDTDIAYIGVTTPDTITSSSPSQFLDANGNYIYSFSGETLYERVQNSIDDAKLKGAEYIIALTHLGTENVYMQWSAQSLVQNTSGLDAVLDGHSHSIVPKLKIKDKTGSEVLISSTGTKFENIGKLTINNGEISTSLIKVEDYKSTDAEITALIKKINDEYSVLGDRKIGVSKVDLITHNEKGERIIRNTETNLGDFCADAFRVATGADIGFINGGGIREKLDKGDVTFNDILSIFPFNNRVVVIEATGQQIVDMLELGVLNYPNEDGTFQHVSGITFEIDKNIKSSVELDANLMFVGVKGERRVKNVKVLKDGKYQNIDLKKTYTLASHNYLLLDLGGGASMFKGAKVVSDVGLLDVELLEIYLTLHLNGVIDETYEKSQNRITLYTKPAKQPSVDTGDDLEPSVAVEIAVICGFAILILAKKRKKSIFTGE